MAAPILVSAFSRPDKLEKILVPLQGVTNPIYCVVDGPRDERDLPNIDSVKRVIDKSGIDFRNILYFDQNQGTDSVAKGIDWVLGDNDSIIVVEEDVLISSQFLSFAERLLEYYADNESIGSISAMNLVPKSFITRPEDHYRYSCYFYAWGWATWKSRWDQMISINSWNVSALKTPKTARHPLTAWKWKARLRDVEAGRAQGLWDYRWIYTYWTNSWLTIIPNVNLALNIGFDTSASHTKVPPDWAPQFMDEIKNPLEHSREIKQDLSADSWSSRYVHNSHWTTIAKTITKNKMKSLRNE